MDNKVKLPIAITLTGFIALGVLVFLSFFYPPNYNSSWLIAFATLLLLSIASELLGLQVSEEGSFTSFEPIPHLAASLLIGPLGAAILAGLGVLIYEAGIARKEPKKFIFNTAQFSLTVAAAGTAFVFLGGQPSVANLGYPQSLLPFSAAVLTYSAVNSILVATVISISEGQRLLSVWRELKGQYVVFDLTISLVGYPVALLYIKWGAAALILTIIPLFGLRYIYGINIELQQLNRDLLRVLVKTIEAQDPYTSGHSLRVAEYSKEISEELGLSFSEIRTVETAALLHDIGKIDRAYRQILRQTGPLTEEQRKLIQEHPERGVRLLESVRALDDEILEAIRHHHERFDGTGYPDGLEAEAIPLPARIIMIADTIDAMLTARSYRDKLTIHVVREELTKYKGTQFDPRGVEAVFNCNLLSKIEGQPNSRNTRTQLSDRGSTDTPSPKIG